MSTAVDPCIANMRNMLVNDYKPFLGNLQTAATKTIEQISQYGLESNRLITIPSRQTKEHGNSDCFRRVVTNPSLRMCQKGQEAKDQKSLILAKLHDLYLYEINSCTEKLADRTAQFSDFGDNRIYRLLSKDEKMNTSQLSQDLMHILSTISLLAEVLENYDSAIALSIMAKKLAPIDFKAPPAKLFNTVKHALADSLANSKLFKILDNFAQELDELNKQQISSKSKEALNHILKHYNVMRENFENETVEIFLEHSNSLGNSHLKSLQAFIEQQLTQKPKEPALTYFYKKYLAVFSSLLSQNTQTNNGPFLSLIQSNTDTLLDSDSTAFEKIGQHLIKLKEKVKDLNKPLPAFFFKKVPDGILQLIKLLPDSNQETAWKSKTAAEKIKQFMDIYQLLNDKVCSNYAKSCLRHPTVAKFYNTQFKIFTDWYKKLPDVQQKTYAFAYIWDNSNNAHFIKKITTVAKMDRSKEQELANNPSDQIERLSCV